MTNVYNGFEFWTYEPLTKVIVDNNKVTLNVDGFFYTGLPIFAAGEYAATFCIGINEWGKAVTRLKITTNTFNFTKKCN